jgi:hypothetical protein
MTGQLLPAPPRDMAEFAGRNGQFDGDGRAVHAVAPQPWIGGLQVPGPACHTPNGSFDPATFNPVTAYVTCRRCLRSSDARAAAAPLVDPDQMTLPIAEEAP